ncbi:MAG: hypothetical protein K8S99_11585 [Planctomycetes bacterium]|nr:hypothetical protein [Planctomycetota bacterium]
MNDTAPTTELKFGAEPSGLYIAHDDLRLYRSALQAIREGRSDPICQATFAQLMDLMNQAADDDIGDSVAVCKSFDDCRITTAKLDSLIRT